jgi:predicted RNA binding protein YcfA (HicA-like mRNA interferase family)
MKYGEFFKILKQDGWYELRQSGSHVVMAHPTKKNKIVVPSHASKEVKKGLLQSILKDAELKITKQ